MARRMNGEQQCCVRPGRTLGKIERRSTDGLNTARSQLEAAQRLLRAGDRESEKVQSSGAAGAS